MKTQIDFKSTTEHAELIKRGFKTFQLVSNSIMNKSADYFYQQKVLNYGKETMYFINLYVYDWSLYTHSHKTNYSYLVEVYLYYPDKNCLVLNFSIESLEFLDETINRIDQIYENQGCVPDLHNND